MEMRPLLPEASHEAVSRALHKQANDTEDLVKWHQEQGLIAWSKPLGEIAERLRCIAKAIEDGRVVMVGVV